ncbi:MAG: adenylyl-sulfate kinase [Acidimicrobiaceae bacterium]|nr:adenylyl-sulfate kinase [Acidimicrobiaceae bacterium]MYL05162.1 adenylyl-sulfate kinase [Acidimicrobiaceae bacterium]
MGGEPVAPRPSADLLRVLTCGSVDDGKSTLIGRLLHDSDLLYEDHLAAVRKDSATTGHAGGQVDLALLADGLVAEREQGITIDVAHLYFSTPRRSFIIADTPGHEQYTRNMVTGASTSELAVILVDAARGITTQTRRHSLIVNLLGISSVVVAVNKMDLVDYREDRFESIASAVRELASALGLPDPVCIPVSALHGDGVVEPGANMGWYDGPCLMEHLEQVDAAVHAAGASGIVGGRLRLPVQLVIRPDHRFRGFAGTVCEGTLRAGDRVRVEPSGRTTAIARIVTFDGDLEEAPTGRSVVITTSDEIDIGRGDVIVDPAHPPQRARRVTATIVWMAEADLVVGREYLLAQGGQTMSCRVSEVMGRLDVDALESVPAAAVRLNDIATVTVRTDAELIFDPYTQNRTTGSFILIERSSNATVAAGMIEAAAPAAAWEAVPGATLERQRSSISGAERAERLGQRPATVLLTGLTGAGKSTIASALERELFERGRTTVRLDGENMRLGVSRDLGFSSRDRSENVRRTAELARLVNDQGLIAIAALVAPSAAVRERARELIGADRFVEVFLDPPLEVCRARDRAGLYEAADRGEIRQFPGVSAPYDKPANADLVLDTSRLDVDACVRAITAWLEAGQFIGAVETPEP